MSKAKRTAQRKKEVRALKYLPEKEIELKDIPEFATGTARYAAGSTVP